MHACSLISLASFSICMILCFILTPSLICFKGSPREKWALLFRVSTQKNMKKPNLSLTRPYPLTRVKRRDFWSLPSDFPITHPNPIWKQCLGETWCCFNLISNYFVFLNNNIPTPSQFWAVLCALCGAIEHAENGPYKLGKGNRNRSILVLFVQS